MEDTPQNKFLIPLAIVVAGGLVAGAIYYGDSSGTANIANTNTAAKDIEVAAISDKDHILGSRTAELVVVEYSDTECPFCKVFHNTMKEIVNTYSGKVSWVYRHFPIQQLHAKAIKEAEATECAAELGGNEAFWNYIDRLFVLTNSNDSLDLGELPKIAGAVGLDVASFNTCLSSGRHTNAVNEMIEEAYKAGARGTPYSVILTQDGEKIVINGAEPLAKIKTRIDALLK